MILSDINSVSNSLLSVFPFPSSLSTPTPSSSLFQIYRCYLKSELNRNHVLLWTLLYWGHDPWSQTCYTPPHTFYEDRMTVKIFWCAPDAFVCNVYWFVPLLFLCLVIYRQDQSKPPYQQIDDGILFFVIIFRPILNM